MRDCLNATLSRGVIGDYFRAGSVYCSEEPMHMRIVKALLLVVTLTGIAAGCAVTVDERRCPYGWEPAHRDRWGRWVPGHCR
jgi:hypothetical protein